MLIIETQLNKGELLSLWRQKSKKESIISEDHIKTINADRAPKDPDSRKEWMKKEREKAKAAGYDGIRLEHVQKNSIISENSDHEESDYTGEEQAEDIQNIIQSIFRNSHLNISYDRKYGEINLEFALAKDSDEASWHILKNDPCYSRMIIKGFDSSGLAKDSQTLNYGTTPLGLAILPKVGTHFAFERITVFRKKTGNPQQINMAIKQMFQRLKTIIIQNKDNIYAAELMDIDSKV